VLNLSDKKREQCLLRKQLRSGKKKAARVVKTEVCHNAGFAGRIVPKVALAVASVLTASETDAALAL
jgi:hypothetical protein